jgi:predicted ABC-type sugar transport system permease subunit
MLTSSARIAITCWFVGSLAIAAQAVWLLLRGKKKLPVKRTVMLSVLFALLGAAQIVRADGLVAYPTWFYLSNAAGLLLGLGGATYAAAMQRSQSFTL